MPFVSLAILVFRIRPYMFSEVFLYPTTCYFLRYLCNTNHNTIEKLLIFLKSLSNHFAKLLTHFILLLHFIEKPFMWFAITVPPENIRKPLVSIRNSTFAEISEDIL